MQIIGIGIKHIEADRRRGDECQIFADLFRCHHAGVKREATIQSENVGLNLILENLCLALGEIAQIELGYGRALHRVLQLLQNP